MLGRIFKSLVAKARYRLVARQKLFVYKDYQHYKNTQIAGNLRKLNQVWANEENIAYLSRYLKEEARPLSFGICHGTRQGREQAWFRKHLGIQVIGTEISPTARDFPHTIEWDFHEVKPEWIDRTDFIYSNSFDHSYQPEKCLDAWMSCIRKSGVCILEWTTSHVDADELDPFGATLAGIKKLIRKNYDLKAVLKAPGKVPVNAAQPVFLVICHRETRKSG